MIKVIAKNTVQAIEIIEAFKDTTADLTIEIKNTTATNSDVELIITPDDVQTINPSKGAVAKLSKPLIEWLRVHGNPHQRIVIDCGGVRVVADETYAPFETIE